MIQTMARTTAVSVDGRNIYVGDGAVRQQGPKKLYQCNACGREVVWLESKKSGRVYLADVYRGEVVRYYISKPHNCRPYVASEAVETARELTYREQAEDELTRRHLARELTREQYVAGLEAIEKVFSSTLGDD